MDDQLQINDVGVVLEYELYDTDGNLFDISGASVILLTYTRPHNDNLVVAPVVAGTGLLRYITEDGDINIQGNWKVQVYVEVGLRKFHSEIKSFYVYPNL